MWSPLSQIFTCYELYHAPVALPMDLGKLLSLLI